MLRKGGAASTTTSSIISIYIIRHKPTKYLAASQRVRIAYRISAVFKAADGLQATAFQRTGMASLSEIVTVVGIVKLIQAMRVRVRQWRSEIFRSQCVMKLYCTSLKE